MTSVIEAAAQSLRDDPTFYALTPEGRELEARVALNGAGGNSFDPALVADVLGMVEMLEPTPAPVANLVDRPHIPVALKGRVTHKPVTEVAKGIVAARAVDTAELERAPVVAATIVDPAKVHVAVVPPVAPPAPKPPKPPPVAPPTASLRDQRASILYRFKVVTGVSDVRIATLLGIPRSTVQACIARRVVETLSDAQKALLHSELLLAKADIEALLADI